MTKLTISPAMRAGFNAADKVAGLLGAVATIADMIKALGAEQTGMAELRAEIITGVIARDLYRDATLTAANVTKAQTVLAKAGKTRSEAESRAEANGRKIWSRAMKAAGLKSAHGNAGNANAGKGATAKPESARPESAQPVKVAPVAPDVMTRAALLQGVVDALATYASKGKAMPDVAAADIAAMVAARKLIDARLKIKFD